jgi:hypothetical protein
LKRQREENRGRSQKVSQPSGPGVTPTQRHEPKHSRRQNSGQEFSEQIYQTFTPMALPLEQSLQCRFSVLPER